MFVKKETMDRDVSPEMKGLDEQDKCRSLVCDPSGIIIAEMVYRCMICYYITDSVPEAREHYAVRHMQEEEEEEEDGDQMNHSHSPQMPVYQNNLSRGQRSSNNALIPDISLYEDQVPPSFQFTPNNSMKQQQQQQQQQQLHQQQNLPEATPPTNGSSNAKSGYVNCAVCGVTRFYSCVQRRYGQFTCVTCYRYFRTFLLKPKKYACPNLGACPLNVRTRCRACWIKACISVFSVDARRQQVIDCNQPVKKLPTNKVTVPITGIRDNAENGGNGLNPLIPKITVSFDAMPPLSDESEIVNQSLDEMPPLPKMVLGKSGDRRASVTAKLVPKLVVTGKKVWSCGKCTTCTAEDCGKCIYCLDRPKFGGPFIKKQRCIKRRCLMKIKNKQTLLRN